MRKLKFICLNLLFINSFFEYKSQTNLVPNPSFETSVNCPTITGMLSVANWTSFRESPDYFNVCSQASTCGTPKNAMGRQQPATGNAYCGFLNYWPGIGAREYLGAKLTQTLTVGKKYFLSMKVSLAERWLYDSIPLFIPSNKCGMKFTGTMYSKQNPYSPNNVAPLYASTIISDTTGWTTLRGMFVADSAYQYVVLGNFFSNSQTDTIMRPLGFDSYFFVDDIVVSTDSTVLLNGIVENQTTDIGITDISISESKLKINSTAPNLKVLQVYSIMGELLESINFVEEAEVPLYSLNSGLYLIAVLSDNQAILKKKIVIASD